MTDLAKTQYTAAVLIPPAEAWDPIQRIRRLHDPQVRRWMPHITILYPFVPEVDFAAAAERMTAVCRGHPPIQVTLKEFRFFEHSVTSATLWLDPEPREAIVRLQADLQGAFPHLDDVSRFQGGFAPHLSVGRFPGAEAVQAALRRFQFGWIPLGFTVDAVSLIARSGVPDDPFHLRLTVPLGE